MVLETERLVLSRFVLDDGEFIAGLLNQPSFLQFIGDRGVRDLASAQAYIANGPIASYAANGFGLYRVSRKDRSDTIGMCGLLKRSTLDDADLGFAFLPHAWGAGYATEAARAVLAHASRDCGLARVVAIVSPENHASKAVLARLDFTYERTTRLTPEAHEVDLFGRAVSF